MHRLLFLSQTLPYPPDSGVKSRTYNVLRELSRGFEVHALCFHRRRGADARAPLPPRLDALGQFGVVEAFAIPQEAAAWRFVADHLRSVITRRPYVWYTYDSPRFLARVRGLVSSGRFDLVHLDSLDLMRYLPLLGGLPVVCVHHDVQSSLLFRRADRAHRGPVRSYLRHQARLMEAAERVWLERVGLNVAVSDVDALRCRTLAPTAPVTVVPNGVDIEYFKPVAGPKRDALFVGGADWLPNRDAMDYFVASILPLVRTRLPDMRVRWAGWSGSDIVDGLGRQPGVEILGYQDDLRATMGSAACFVAPIRIGGGTRVKILDAWAMGMAVISTSIGCEGLKASDDDNILIRDEPAAFADAVAAVLTDATLRERLGNAGRRTAASTYSWRSIGTAMVEEYQRLVLSRQEAGT